jgi:hypothetical protein
VPNRSDPDLSLFLDILHRLEEIDVPYVIVGGFAAAIYGITRATYDIDIIIDLNQEHIQALVDAYPLPRYYADPHQMHQAMKTGGLFNIIDTKRGEKADLFSITMDERYHPALENRLRQMVELPGMDPFAVWAARPEDVIVGKLMAWAELQTRRHESDIYELMVRQYLGGMSPTEHSFDEKYVDDQARSLGQEVSAFWQAVKEAAQQEAERNQQ